LNSLFDVIDNMKNFKFLLQALAMAATLLTPMLVSATNGYFSHGYGAKAQGIAGVGIALPLDGLAAATNPAGTALVGNRYDFGLTLFVPSRGADIRGNGAGLNGSYSGDGTSTFLIPDFGYTRQINANLSVGLAVYGNGGMNTDYGQNPFASFFPPGTAGSAGINLEQLFISPSLAYKVSDANTFGAALNVAYQRFEAKGLPFGNPLFSSSPANVSDKGVDSSTGVGVRLGWIGKVSPQLSLGATWASKISGKFDNYKGLFADGGGFDVPENYGFGLAFEATPVWTLAADVQTIRYSQVGSVGNSVSKLLTGTPLGAANGPGFGWKDVTVLKLGVSHKLRSDLTLRGGVSVANQPVPDAETFFNILAPGVITKHLTLGATWTTPSDGELTGYLAHAFGETVSGKASIAPGTPPAGFGGGAANVRLKENLIGISYGWKF
jgi:long-chain fatty acid transport protein